MSDLIETWKADFKLFAKSLNLSRDDYKTMMEYIDEIHAVQPDHVADISKKAEGDCISRQAAIDALGVFTQADALGHTPKQIVEALPPAQPEIVRCKDCDWWTKQEDSLQGRCELMQMYPTEGWYCGNARRRGGETE